jgi:hypothetical protein
MSKEYNDDDRLLDADLGEQDGLDPGIPEDVIVVPTDWEDDDDAE